MSKYVIKSTFCILAIFIVTILGGVSYSVQYPRPQGFVNDFANVISQEVENKLEAVLTALEQKTTAEVSVVTVKTIEPLDIESYAVELFSDWKIGKKGKDNGVLILLAMLEKKVRIEVGYGLEGALPDGLCGQIIDDTILPFFKKGDFSNGIFNGTLNVVNIVAKEYNVDIFGELKIAGPPYPVRQTSPLAALIRTIFSLLFFILIFGFRMGLFGFLLFGPRSRGYWSSGGFGGGGFGGFGGGFSGGGGASRGW